MTKKITSGTPLNQLLWTCKVHLVARSCLSDLRATKNSSYKNKELINNSKLNYNQRLQPI